MVMPYTIKPAAIMLFDPTAPVTKAFAPNISSGIIRPICQSLVELTGE